MNSVTETKSSENNPGTASGTDGWDFAKISSLLRRRRWLIGGVLTVVTGISGVMAVVAKPVYQSSMQLLVSSSLYQQSRNSSEKTGPDFTDSNLQVDYTAQMQLMTSTKLLQRAIDALKSEYPTLKIEDLRGQPGAKSPMTVQQLQAGIGSNKVPSQVFTIAFIGKDAVKTQRVLESLKQVYLDYNLEEQKQRLAKSLTFINEQLPKVKARVTQSEQSLERFRRNYNLLDPEAQGKSSLDALSGIQQERRKLHAEADDLQAQLSSNQQKLAQSPQEALIASRLSQSSRYQSLLNEIQRTELALVEKRLVYQEKTPIVQQLVERRQEQLGLLQQEIGRVLGGEAPTAGLSESPAASGSVLQQGQLSSSDLKLVERLVENQATLTGMVARDRELADQEEQLQTLLKQYPHLLSQYNRLKPEAEANRKTLEQLLDAQQSISLKVAQGGFDWQVVEDPAIGLSTGDSKLMRLVIGVFVGTILGIVAALLAEQWDPVIYSTQKLRKQTGLPLLGSIPRFSLPKESDAAQGPFKLLFQPTFRSAMDRIYRSLNFSPMHRGGRSLVLTSVLPGDGKSTLALGLALSAARFNHRVLVIDADMQSPCLHTMLDLSNDRGLFDLLTEATLRPPEKLIQTWQPMVDILTAGEPIGDATRFLRTDKMQRLLHHLEKSYDLILIDTPPSLAMVDASFVAEFCQGLILVARIGQIKQPELMQTLEMLALSNIRGIVANHDLEMTGKSDTKLMEVGAVVKTTR